MVNIAVLAKMIKFKVEFSFFPISLWVSKVAMKAAGFLNLEERHNPVISMSPCYFPWRKIASWPHLYWNPFRNPLISFLGLVWSRHFLSYLGHLGPLESH